jgi:hypothetical protein
LLTRRGERSGWGNGRETVPIRGCRVFSLAAALLLTSTSLGAEPKPPKPEDLPKIAVAIPMGIVVGTTTKLTLRGVKLDGVTSVQCQAPTAKAKLLNKGSADDIARIGKTRAEIEITLPADHPGSTVTVSVTNAAGESNAHRLIVDRAAVLLEKEPNNSFAQAQPIAIGQTVAGAIDKGFDVDVYRFEGKAGQHITAEVVAARFGSALDSLLTLYTGDGQTIAANDDLDGTTPDSRLEASLPRVGTYFLVLVDANDHGGPAHVYRLSLHAKP